jgi:uncharacterized coiled-coil protein SlyX
MSHISDGGKALYGELRKNTLQFIRLLIAYHKRLEEIEKKIIVLAGIINCLDKDIITDNQWYDLCKVAGIHQDDLFDWLERPLKTIQIELSDEVAEKYIVGKDEVISLKNKLNALNQRMAKLEKTLAEKEDTTNNQNNDKLKKKVDKQN